jgi:hypothetical protein
VWKCNKPRDKLPKRNKRTKIDSKRKQEEACRYKEEISKEKEREAEKTNKQI